MTGRQLKRTIFDYLESRGWVNRKPDQYYAWDPPPCISGSETVYYCWHAALLMQLAFDENSKPWMPEGAFEVLTGGRR